MLRCVYAFVSYENGNLITINLSNKKKSYLHRTREKKQIENFPPANRKYRNEMNDSNVFCTFHTQIEIEGNFRFWRGKV